jgi:hypothetical protein
MSDLRATERLLEVIGEQVARAERELAVPLSPTTQSALTEILAISHELRRRGDTLVRSTDLRTIIQLSGNDVSELNAAEGEELDAVVNRLEIALGGKLR